MNTRDEDTREETGQENETSEQTGKNEPITPPEEGTGTAKPILSKENNPNKQ